MLYKLNWSDIDYYFDLFEKHAYMNKILKFIDFNNDINIELIKKCIYMKIYNPWKTVWKEYIDQLPITKKQKSKFLKEFDHFFDSILKKHSITLSKELFLLTFYLWMIVFYFKPINSFINSIINNYTSWKVSEILLYNIDISWHRIWLWTFLFIALTFALLSYLSWQIQLIKEIKKQ